MAENLQFVFDDVDMTGEPEASSREITDVMLGGVVRARNMNISIAPGIPRIFMSNKEYPFFNPQVSVYGRRVVSFFYGFSNSLP